MNAVLVERVLPRGQTLQIVQGDIPAEAMPAISTGIFGFPKDRAADIIFSAIEKYFVENPSSGIKTVELGLFDQSSMDVSVQVWRSGWGQPA